MKVTIVSGFTGGTWTGEVEGDPTLEDLFRMFNRVDEADGERLNAIGYALPSLTAGDLIIRNDRYENEPEAWLVAACGFARVEGFGALGALRAVGGQK